MSSKKKTLFISDIHLGTGEKWDWFDIKKESPYLINFFKYVQKRYTEKKDIKEIVLLGDIFDLWVCPHDKKPQTFDDICNAQTSVINAIKETAKTVPTLYVNGNHDFRVTEQNINDAFNGNVKHIGNEYRRANIHAEHGHMYALFNRPDPKNGGHSRLPLGYYISRLYATLGESHDAKKNLILESIDEIFQMMGPENLPESVLDAVKDSVESTKELKVSEFNMKGVSSNQSYDEIKNRYKNLFNDWFEAKGFWYSIQMLLSEINRLGTIADDLCRNGTDIVVFGHSHDTKLDKDSWLVKNRIYANCGYWCGLGEENAIDDNAHFVETDGESVQLYKFNHGDVILKKEEDLK